MIAGHDFVFEEGYIRPGVFAYEISVGAMYSYKWDDGFFSSFEADSTQFKTNGFNYGVVKLNRFDLLKNVHKKRYKLKNSWYQK